MVWKKFDGVGLRSDDILYFEPQIYDLLKESHGLGLRSDDFLEELSGWGSQIDAFI